MSVKSYFMKTGRRIGAALLSAAMVLSLVPLPASAATDEDVVWDFDASPQKTVDFTVNENETDDQNKYQAEHLFLQENNEDLNQKLANSVGCELKATVKIVNYNGDWSKLVIMPFVAAGDTEGGWNNGWTEVEADTDTYDLAVDLSSHKAAGQLGFRFIQTGGGEADKSISYEVLSAQIVSNGTAGSGTGGSTGGDATKTLVADYGAVASKTEKFSPNKPDYMSQFIVNHYFINGLTDKVGGQNVKGNNWELQVEVKVTDYTGDKDQLEMFLFAMDENYTNWGEGARKKLSDEDSYTLTYGLSNHSNFQQLGLRFLQEENVDNEITYEILSAKIVSKEVKEPELDDSELTDFNETLDEGNWNDKKEVTVAENIYVPGQFYIKHQFRNIPHDLSMGGLGGFEALRMKVNVTVHTYTKGDNSNAEALIYAMDGSYENWKQNQVLLNGDGLEQTVEITLDLSKCYMLHPRESLGEIGFEITGLKDGTPVEYTINDARIIGKGAANQILTDIKLKDEYKLTGEVKHVSYANTPVGKHGKLSVQNVDGYSAPVIVDKNGEPYQLRGASSHGLSWFPEYVNEDAYRSLRDEWGMNLVRIAIYPREGEYGYISDKLGPSKDNAAEYNDELIMKGVEAAKKLGMYVMIDWHVLDYNPNKDTEEATAFFQKYAQLYKDYDNVLFEICNEPAGTKWYNGEGAGNDLYTYCKTVTQAIRDEENDAIVICGTNNFSQDVDEVADKPLSEDGFENIMYTCHFYAATHYDTQFNRFKAAVEKSGIPVFVTEFGICTASGDGYYDTDAADNWLDYCDENGIGYSCWAMSNSTESAAYFKTTCTKLSGWTEDDLTVTSTYLVNRCNDTAKKLGDAVGFSLENEGDHAYTQTVTKAATCTEAGVSTFTCSCEYSYTVPIPATGHSKETVLKNAKEATCKEEGYTGDECCTVCGTPVKVGTVIPKTNNHSWDAGKVTTAATETTDGVKTFTCIICGTTRTETIPATGTTECKHEETEVRGSEAATCKEEGYTGDTYCKNCNELLEKGEVIPKTEDHVWNEGVVTEAATETKDGVRTLTCTICGTTKTETIPATGTTECKHEETEVRGSKAATCKEEGYTGDTYCKNCDELLEKGKVIPKTNDHSWDSGKVTTAATDTKDGVKTLTCTICGTTKTETIPATGGKVEVPENNFPKKGTILKSGKNSYKVTKAGSTVEFVKTTSTSTKITVLATVKIDGITYKVTSIAKNAFKNNKKVKTVTIGKNVTTIGASAFSGCSKLSKVTIGNNVTAIGKSAFYNCTSLKKITIPGKVTTIGASAFKGCKKLATITIKSTKLKSVGKNAFKGIKSNAKIKVPSKKLKSYKKTLNKRGQGKNVKIVKG